MKKVSMTKSKYHFLSASVQNVARTKNTATDLPSVVPCLQMPWHSEWCGLAYIRFVTNNIHTVLKKRKLREEF